MNHLKFHLIVLLFVVAVTARSDYGWIPEYQKLVTKIGFESFSTSQNFDADGAVTPLVYQSQAVVLTDRIFWLSAEYGLAESWAAEIRASFMNSLLEPSNGGGSYLSGIGAGDFYSSLKWNIKSVFPFLTIETRLKFPTANASQGDSEELVLGDGNFDLGIFLHSGNTANRFRISLSPGILMRFGGYSSALVVDGAVEYRLPRGYIGAFVNYFYSFSDPQLYDSTPDRHDARGSGNSYARLTGGPIGFSAGGKLGFRMFKDFSLEVQYAKALFGSKYPDFSRFGLSLVAGFDFFEPSKKPKIREVPFDFDYRKFDKEPEQP